MKIIKISFLSEFSWGEMWENLRIFMFFKILMSQEDLFEKIMGNRKNCKF